MIELVNALMDIHPVHLFLGVGAVFAMCSGDSASLEEDDNSDYDNASWTPASVNYHK
jgi:hypothetical protein